MPGVYLEKHSRTQPTNDPACAQYTVKSDGGDPGALTHDYQMTLPQRRQPGRGDRPRAGHRRRRPTRRATNRHGIPNLGPCIRCNLQLEGSGVSADDVVVEAGDPAAGNGGPSAVGNAKDVGIFVDRADGFVLRNLTVRHAREHDIYVLETDGYLLDRFKTFYAGGYGVLTFVEDHGVIAELRRGRQRRLGHLPGLRAPTRPTTGTRSSTRSAAFSQVIRYCDSHHNTGGFSGTDEPRHPDRRTTTSTTTRWASRPTCSPRSGHPGFPQHGNVIRGTTTSTRTTSTPTSPAATWSRSSPRRSAPGCGSPAATSNVVKNNHFYDNWRRGTMLFAVPDATVCGPPPVGSDAGPGLRPDQDLDVVRQPVLRQRHGRHARRRGRAERRRLLVGRVPGQHRQLLVGQHGCPGSVVDDLAAAPARLQRRHRTGAQRRHGRRAERERAGRLPRRLHGLGLPRRATARSATGPRRPRSRAPTAASRSASTTAPGGPAGGVRRHLRHGSLATPLLAVRNVLNRLSGTVASAAENFRSPLAGATPVYPPGRLGNFTCSWWRQADDDHKLGMVQRIRHLNDKRGQRVAGRPRDLRVRRRACPTAGRRRSSTTGAARSRRDRSRSTRSTARRHPSRHSSTERGRAGQRALERTLTRPT